MDGFFVKLAGDSTMMKFGAGLPDIPVIGVVLKGAKFQVAESGDVWPGDAFGALGHDAINASGVGEVDGVAADVGVVPIENVDSSVGTDFHTESDPGEVVGWHEVAAVAPDVGGTIRVHVIDKNGVLVDIAHEELVAVFGGKCIGEIESCSTVCGEVGVIPDRLNRSVGVGVEVGS